MDRKKQIKNQVKENGFYVNFVADKLTYSDAVKKVSSVKAEQVVFDSKEDIPEGDNIVVLSGILSQNYPVGKKSRNGYKILQTGVDYSDYKFNNIVLLQHNDRFGGIGRTRMIYLDNKGNSNIIMYVDLNTIDSESVRYQIKNGYMKGVSTGHDLIESMFEDVKDKGNLLTWEDAGEKYGFNEVWGAVFGMSDTLIYTVTKALMIENSVVAIGSNEKAILTHDTIGNYAIKSAMSEEKLKSLFADKNNMKTDELKKLISDSVLTKKEQASLNKMIDSAVEQEEEKEIEPKEENQEEPKEETKEEVKENVEEKAEDGKIEDNLEKDEPKEEPEEEKEIDGEQEKEDESEKEDGEDGEGEKDDEDNSGDEGEDKENNKENDGGEADTTDELKDKKMENKEGEDEEEEPVKKEVPTENKLSNSVEKHTNEISTLKNELVDLRNVVDSLLKKNDTLQKVCDDLTEVVTYLSDLSVKNSKNLSNIVAIGVSEVTKVDVESAKGALGQLKNTLSKQIK